MSQTWKIYSLVVVALLLSAVLPFVVPMIGMALLLGLIIGSLSVYLLLKNPYPGYVFLIIGAIAIPFEIGTGTQSSINPAMVTIAALFGLWVLDLVVDRKKWSTIIKTRSLLPPVLLVVAAIFSFLVGQLHWYPIQGASIASQFGGTALFFLSAALLVVTAHQIKSLAFLQLLCWIFIGCSWYYLIFSHIIPTLVPSLSNTLVRLFSRGTPGSLLWTWIFAITFSQVLCNNKMKIIYKVPLALLLGVVVYFRIVSTSFWSSGWVPGVAALAVIALVHLRWAGVGLGALGGLSYLLYGAFFSNLLLADNQYSLDTRVDAWVIAANIFKVNPLFGLGPSNYYNYTSLYPIRGYFVPFNSHNNYVDLLLEVGLVGFLIFLWMLFEIWNTGWKLKSVVPQGFAYAYVIGCLGGVAGTAVAAMFGDWVIPFVYNIGFQGFRASMLSFLFFGGLIAMDQMYRKKELQ